MTKPTILAVSIGGAGAGVAALGAALFAGPLLWVCAWTAASCLVVSAAYARNRPGVFGKRDGRLARVRVLLLLPYLLAFWVACALMRARRRDPPCSEVAPGLFVGGRLSGADLPPGIEFVVDLTSEFSEPADLRELPGYRCLPVLDGSTPPDEDAFLALLAEAASGRVVFHCESGRGRAPTAAALAIVLRGVVGDAASALELVAKGRPCSAPTRSDRRFVERVGARLASRGRGA